MIIIEFVIAVICIGVVWVVFSESITSASSFFLSLEELKNLSIEKKYFILHKLIEHNTNNKDLTYARSRNGIGSNYYKIANFSIEKYKIDIFSKNGCFLFFPITPSFGYLICCNDKIISTVSKKNLESIKTELANL